MIPRLTPIVPTRKMSEAIGAVCKRCGGTIFPQPSSLIPESVRLHSCNGTCTRRDITLLAVKQ